MEYWLVNIDIALQKVNLNLKFFISAKYRNVEYKEGAGAVSWEGEQCSDIKIITLSAYWGLINLKIVSVQYQYINKAEWLQNCIATTLVTWEEDIKVGKQIWNFQIWPFLRAFENDIFTTPPLPSLIG